MMTTLTSSEASRIHNLTSLISTVPSASPNPNSPGPSRKIYPNDDSIVAVLQARSRSELPYSRVSPSGLDYVVVNPLRVLGCLGEESRKGYQRDIDSTNRAEEERQPNVYELAGRVWSLMTRRRESQSVIYQ